MVTNEGVCILVPRRRDRAHRDALWAYCRPFWEELGLPIWEGYHDNGPFNRSAAINWAARLAGDWRVAVIIDADVRFDVAGVAGAISLALSGRVASGYDVRKNLSRAGTRVLMSGYGYRGSWERYVISTWPKCLSGALAVPRVTWDEVGGFDERFVGWYGEDTAFEAACETVRGRPVHRVHADLFHLWHSRARESIERGQSPLYRANVALMKRYEDARGSRRKMAVLLDETDR